MYNLGPTEFPMTRAYVYTVLPSLFSSTKLSTTGEVIGTFLQDRATAIAGRLGPGPRMIPVTLTLESDRGPKRTFNFGVVKDQLFTPLMTYASALSTRSAPTSGSSARRPSASGARRRVKKHDADRVRQPVLRRSARRSSAAAYVVGAAHGLMGNDYEKVDIEGLELTIDVGEEPRTATLERVWLDDPRPRAGRTVPLKVLLRTYRGEDVVRTMPIEIPANASGTLSVLVSDGAAPARPSSAKRGSPQPRSVPQLIRALNKARRNNTLYVKLLGSEAGAVVNGELLSSLPPSVLAVLEADRSGGNFNPLHSATLGEWELPTEHAVSGVRTLTITGLAELTRRLRSAHRSC